ncbi:MAG: hypothetical protein M1823_004494 [Watsoniomyces obsoletus]|nr:MAG: hypothetical protein M1823_004494 [Watsoniomyces obsoletus]
MSSRGDNASWSGAEEDSSDSSSTQNDDVESHKESNSSPDPEEVVIEDGAAPEVECPSTDPTAEKEPPLLRPRSYQLEMLEKSLEENIIVAMETGSGKTHVAILRIRAELERCPTDKLIWFLAPTLALCEQQYGVLCLHIPSVQTRFLRGEEVELWTEQSIWDAVLKNIRIVVSTPKVLLDGLTHAFVRLASIALLVVDEAHHCTKGHPVNKIMTDFYHPARKKGDERVPHILGLTASPVINAKDGGLEEIESNINAISKTPKQNYEELLKFVHKPVLRNQSYEPSNGRPSPTSLFQRLLSAISKLDIREDPYVMGLRSRDDPFSRDKLEKAIRTRRTPAREQLHKLCLKGMHILSELGDWAADLFLLRIIRKLRASVVAKDKALAHWNDPQKNYLLGILTDAARGFRLSKLSHADPTSMSSKVNRFIDLLVQERTPSFAGLVFIEQRVDVALLAEILSRHPRTKKLFRCGTFIGTSSSSYHKTMNLTELLDPRDQKSNLDDLRGGKKNLIISTSVLDEGIDVSACHIVICFNPPPNLKTFIQRRGRARRKESKYVMMMHPEEITAKQRDWDSLEARMKAKYMNEMRQLEEWQEREGQKEEYKARFEIEATGALLTPDDAVPHLHHFCQVLPADPYVNRQPEFRASKSEGTSQTEVRISADVTLPTAVPSHLRCSSSRYTWKTERTAKKDACFEAMLALHKAGLINDHLLPLLPRRAPDVLGEKITHIAAIVEVAPLLNPWIDVARQITDSESFSSSVLTFWAGEEEHTKMRMLLPIQSPMPVDFNLFWNTSTKWRVTCEPGPSVASMTVESALKSTELLLQSVFPSRLKTDQQDYVAHFMLDSDMASNTHWAVSSRGSRPATDVHQSESDIPSHHGLVHPIKVLRPAYMFKGWSMRIPKPKDGTPEAAQEAEAQGEQLHIDVLRWPKRVDLLHPVPEQQKLHETYSRTKHLLAEEYMIENLPLKYSQFALCIPSILRRYEVYLIAERLCKTVLAPVGFQDLSLVLTAISASSAREESNYQRLEFLGDSILKMCTSVQLMGEHTNWHEGYLSSRKDQIVANSRLARAAINVGLDKFIITQSFTGRKWRPLYVSDLLNAEAEAGYKEEEEGVHSKQRRRREMSTKVLADVVEALIGVAFLEGGFPKALSCIRTFLGEDISWQPLSNRLDQLYDLTPPTTTSSIPNIKELEDIIGHTFTRKALLLEALTHPSYNIDTKVVSYQRLEFLGDSLLDQIVVNHLFNAGPTEIEHFDMHLMRTVLVNADFLAFLCVECFTTQSRVDIHHHSIDPDSSSMSMSTRNMGFRARESSRRMYLWQFMRCDNTSSRIHLAQKECVGRCEVLRGKILEGLYGNNNGNITEDGSVKDNRRYPWTALAGLQADKFFSDIVESVLGAIYIDTRGDLGACESFLEKLGVLPYLRRLLRLAEVEAGTSTSTGTGTGTRTEVETSTETETGTGTGTKTEKGMKMEMGTEKGMKIGMKMGLFHPREELGILAGREKVKYILSWETKTKNNKNGESADGNADALAGGRGARDDSSNRVKDEDDDEDDEEEEEEEMIDDETNDFEGMREGEVNKKKCLECLVKIGDEEIVRVGGGVSKVEVLTRAAEEAVRVILLSSARGKAGVDAGSGGAADSEG